MLQRYSNDRKVDMSTGEVFEDDELSTLDHPVAKALMSGRVPAYIAELVKKHPEDPAAVMYEYDQFAGVAPADFMEYVNRDVTVVGAMMLPHGPYEGMDGNRHDGYWVAFIMISELDKDKNPVVIGCSGQNFFMWVALALVSSGWGVWKKPIKVHLSGNKNSGYRIKSIDRPSPSTRVNEHKE